jgi:hypothetical protein
MAKKTATTGNKRKTIKELQYHIDCYEKQINNQKYIIIGLLILTIIGFMSPYFY